jgi:phosphonopyruvate decarboxylase
MIDAELVSASLGRREVTLFTGVPCSFLTPLINAAISDPRVRYVGATSEGEAAAIAAGAWLAGGSAVVMCQNSGLGNMVNPLSSLAFPSRIPFLALCTWRGRPGISDEPQHELMGRVTLHLLELIEVAWAPFPDDECELEDSLDTAWDAMTDRQLPFCLVVREGDIAGGQLAEPLIERPPRGELAQLGASHRVRRVEVLERLLSIAPPDAPIVATTGKTGRELFTLEDREQHFYLVGAMGCASAVGFGVALHTDVPVIVLDGDGAALMKLGNMATIGVHAPPNLVHVLLDNGVHDSTGGQRTASAGIGLAELAIACGYRRAVSCDSLADFEQAMHVAVAADGPQLVHIRIRPGSIRALGRPTVHPRAVARRFRGFVSRESTPCDPLAVAESAVAGARP